MLIVTVLALTLTAASSALTVFALWRLHSSTRAVEDRIFARIQSALTAFVTSPSEEEPSPLAVLSDQLAVVFAARIMQQLKASMAGISSGISKEAMADAEEEIGAVSPALGILAGILPKKIRNKMLSNPQMVRQLAMFGRGNGAGPARSTGDGNTSVLSRLRQQS